MTRLLGCLVFLLGAVGTSGGFAPPGSPDTPAVAPQPRLKAPVAVTPTEKKMPLTGLARAKPMFDACIYRYGVGTSSRECQAYVDQSLGMYYSYVWMEAARAAETAVTIDPDCAYAWLALNRSLEKWGRGGTVPQTKGLAGILGAPGFASLSDRFTKSPADYALEMARKLMPKASQREQLHIQARL